MNATLNHGAVASSERLQWPLQQNKNLNKATYYYFPQPATHTSAATSSETRGVTGDNIDDNEDDDKEEVGPKRLNDSYTSNSKPIRDSYTSNSTPIRAPTLHADNDDLKLESASDFGANYNMLPQKPLHKSNSYSGYVRPKATLLKHDLLNGRIATSRTDDAISASSYRSTLYAVTSKDLMSSLPNTNYDNDAMVDLSDENDPLMPLTVNSGGGGGAIGGVIGSSSNTRRNIRGSIKSRGMLSSHINLHRKLLLGLVILFLAVMALALFFYLTRAKAQRFLFWIEMQNKWIIVGVLMPLFVAVSFPIVVGYFVLMLTSGYLFGVFKGVLIIVVGANMGVAVVHWTIRSFRHRIPVHKFITNETGRAILRVISGPKAFKVVLLTRLTPIPFGLQNTLFAISAINPRSYHIATFLGLLPAQIINAYLGSTLRSMQEVLSNHGTAVTGYITFGVELICGIGLLVWVVQKARRELTEAILPDISNEGKLKEIDV